MNEQTMNQRNAEAYVHRVGLSEARRSVHYATAKICRCRTCFCCEVFNATQQPDCEGTGKRIDFAAIRNS